MSNAISEYDQQALDFLNLTGAKVDIKLADNQTCPKWGKCEPFRFSQNIFSKRGAVTVPHSHGLQYTVTISREGRKPYTFDFWSSINDTYKSEAALIAEYPNMRELDMRRVIKSAVKPTAYSALTCLSSDVGVHEWTFQEFCDNYGYDTDSRKAKKAYNAVCDQSRALARLFNEEELDQLREIQ